MDNASTTDTTPAPKKPRKKLQKRLKYRPEVVNIILESLRNLSSRRVAHTLAGIGESTFYDWLVEHPEFKQQVEQAEAEACQEAVKSLKKYSKEDWRCAAWVIERKDQHWQKVERVDHTTGGQAITFTLDLGRELNADEDPEAEPNE